MVVITELRRAVPMSANPISRTFTIVYELRRPADVAPAWYVNGPCELPAFDTRLAAQLFVSREIAKYTNGSIIKFAPTHSILWWPPQSPEIRWNIPVRMIRVEPFSIPAALYRKEDWHECIPAEWTFDAPRNRLLLNGIPMGGTWTLIDYAPPVPPEPPRPPRPDEVLYMLNSYLTPGSFLFTTAANSSLATIYKVRMAGGGGGGGGTGTATGGGGGGAGQYKEFTINNRPANSTWLIVIGAEGVEGSNGGDTTINIGGLIIVCNGGRGGARGLDTDGHAPGGLGGSGGVTPAISGLTLVMDLVGQNGQSSRFSPASGGSTLLGMGGVGQVSASSTASGPGAGGAGGWGINGMNGAAGGVIIERMDG